MFIAITVNIKRHSYVNLVALKQWLHCKLLNLMLFCIDRNFITVKLMIYFWVVYSFYRTKINYQILFQFTYPYEFSLFEIFDLSFVGNVNRIQICKICKWPSDICGISRDIIEVHLWNYNCFLSGYMYWLRSSMIFQYHMQRKRGTRLWLCYLIPQKFRVEYLVWRN